VCALRSVILVSQQVKLDVEQFLEFQPETGIVYVIVRIGEVDSEKSIREAHQLHRFSDRRGESLSETESRH